MLRSLTVTEWEINNRKKKHHYPKIIETISHTKNVKTLSPDWFNLFLLLLLLLLLFFFWLYVVCTKIIFESLQSPCQPEQERWWTESEWSVSVMCNRQQKQQQQQNYQIKNMNWEEFIYLKYFFFFYWISSTLLI